MSRHTKKRHHTKRHHTKRHYTKRHRHTKKRLYRKRREFVIVPGSKSVPIFTAPQTKQANKVMMNEPSSTGNIIPGLRNYIKNM